MLSKAAKRNHKKRDEARASISNPKEGEFQFWMIWDDLVDFNTKRQTTLWIVNKSKPMQIAPMYRQQEKVTQI